MSKAVKTTTRQNLKYARLHESEKIQAVHNCFVGRLETPSFFPKLLRDYDFSLDDSFAFITSERLIVEPEEEFKKSSKWAWWVAVQVAGYLMGTPAHGKRVAANRATFTPLEGVDISPSRSLIFGKLSRWIFGIGSTYRMNC